MKDMAFISAVAIILIIILAVLVPPIIGEVLTKFDAIFCGISIILWFFVYIFSYSNEKADRDIEIENLKKRIEKLEKEK